MPFVTIDGCQVSYDSVGGGGKTLLFLHGAGGTRKSWANQLAYFSSAYRAIALDLPGHGDSQGEGDKEVANYREVVKEFIDILSLPQVVLCGHSMGGAIALDFALHYPSQPEAIVLVDAGARFEIPAEYLAAIKTDFVQARAGARERLWGKKTPLSIIEKYEAEVVRTGGEVFYNGVTACNRFDVSGRLGEVRLPTLIVYGMEDVVGAGRSEVLKASIPQAKVELVTDAGHLPMLEQPDVFNAALSRFLGGLS